MKAKTAIITGGGRGIGLGISRQLRDDGFNIVVMGSSPFEKYKDVFSDWPEDELLYVQGDVASQDDRKRCINSGVEKFGRIDLLVNNAGVAPNVRADILEMTEESFDRVVGINTKGALFMAQLAARQMIKQQDNSSYKGMIINIGSISSTVSSTNRGEYCISKAGTAMLTTLLADRLAGDGILVYEVSPGVIATDMTAGVKEKYDKLLERGDFPIKRWGLPEDIANAVSVLASGRLGYTTGETIRVDGGFHIRRL